MDITNFKIQKISSQVINKMSHGADPFKELIKAAKDDNLTPNIIKSACHYINNELWLHKYKTNSTDKINIIDPEEVLKSLQLVSEKTASQPNRPRFDYFSPPNYRDANRVDPSALPKMEKVAFDNPGQAKLDQIIEYNKKKELDNLYISIIKSASDFQKEKTNLYNCVVHSLRRDEVDVNELEFMKLASNDEDVKSTISLAQKNCMKECKIASDIILQQGIDAMNSGSSVNNDSEIYQRIKGILTKKASIKQSIEDYKSKLNEG